eukprot:13867871-Heterocapsa_arctica.AAC.1
MFGSSFAWPAGAYELPGGPRPSGGRRLLAGRATRGCADCAAAGRGLCGAGTPARRNKRERLLAAFGWHSLGAF